MITQQQYNNLLAGLKEGLEEEDQKHLQLISKRALYSSEQVYQIVDIILTYIKDEMK